nr:hypothetical protein [Tanacetum cinerariifolium]
MQDTDEVEPAEVEEVIEVVTAAKLMTEVVTTSTTTIIAAQFPKASAPRRRSSVVIQNPEEIATTSVIVHSEVKSKDKDQVKRKEKQDNAVMTYQALKRKPVTEAHARKNMMVYLKNMAGFKMYFFKGMTYTDIRSIFENHYNSIQAFLDKGEEEITKQKEGSTSIMIPIVSSTSFGDQMSILAKDKGYGQEMHKSKEPKALYGVTSLKDYAVTYANEEMSHHTLYGVKCLQDYVATFKYTRDDVSDSALWRNICDKKDITPIVVHNIYSFYESESLESEVEDLSDIDIKTLTLEQYLALNRNNSRVRVKRPEIKNSIVFEIKSQLLRELRENTFYGGKTEDVMEHLQKILEIASLFNTPEILGNDIMLRVFSLTLTGASKRVTAIQALESIKEKVDHSHRWHREESDKKTSNNSFSTITKKIMILNHDVNSLREGIYKINRKPNMKFRHEEVKSMKSHQRFTLPLDNLKETLEQFLEESHKKQNILENGCKTS